MKWNCEGVTFLYPPDVFTGTFDNAKMQARHEAQVQKKLDDLQAAMDRHTDPLAALRLLNAKDHLRFFQNNIPAFKEAGRYEEAALFLYGRLNAPFASGGEVAVWNEIFTNCDRTRLFSLGAPVTFAAATVYRGSVSGCMRSLSWTPERKNAERLAERWKDSALGGGEIYEVDVTRNDILIVLTGRPESELLLSPEFIRTAAIRPFDHRR